MPSSLKYTRTPALAAELRRLKELATANLGNKIYFTAADKEASMMIADAIGKHTIKKRTYGTQLNPSITRDPHKAVFRRFINAPKDSFIIRNALKDKSTKVRFFAAVILLEQRDGSGLIELEPSLMHSAKVPVFDDDSVMSGRTMDYNASLNLEYITDISAAPILTRLELSDDVEVRNAAHLALGRMGLAK